MPVRNDMTFKMLEHKMMSMVWTFSQLQIKYFILTKWLPRRATPSYIKTMIFISTEREEFDAFVTVLCACVNGSHLLSKQ